MIIRQLFDPDTSSYTYLLADKATREALLIDPVIEQLEHDLKLLEELNCKLLYSLNTHVHADYITASGSLRTQTGCKTALSKNADVGCAEIALSDGDTIQIGTSILRVIETPGHTPTCLSFYTDKHVFSADALPIRGCGRTDFQQGNAAQLVDSITQRVFNLPEETLVHPCHDYHGMLASTIAEEKHYKPHLKLDKSTFIQLMKNLNLPNLNKIHQALPANMACGEKQKT